MSRACVVVACCAALLSGCIEAELVACENGVACPTGYVCDEPHKTCVTPEQATVCQFKLDNEPCLENGACHHGICVPIECGNWLRDPLEMCDDGNTVSGDGCSADCTTNEQCGNGVIDPARGETCDEGDLASHDGCDSQCRTEQLVFTELVQSSTVSRQHMAFAFDDARGKLVMFGGLDASDVRTGETLEFDTATKTFSVRTSRIAPTARYGAGAAYDAKRNVIVMFGGSDPSGLVGDTWTWDGEQWRAMTPSAAPPRRLFPAMTYDSKRRRVLLFGGRNDGPMNDLWAWDGTTWTELTPAMRPPARDRSFFAYDPVRDRVVLFGGSASGTALGDMWFFDGAEWMRGEPATIPSARFGGTFTYDEQHRGLLMIGGASSSPVQLWDGLTWTVIGTNASPVASRFHHVAFYDPATRATVAGLGTISDAYRADLHRLDGDAWSEIVRGADLPAVSEPALAFDVRRGRTVMFGGNASGLGAQQTTWEHDGTAWIQLSPMTPPPARFGAAMAYDERRGKIVMWGGSTLDPDVHEWDGFTWTSIAALGPAPRTRTELVYDTTTGTTFMFGGEANTTRFGDAWRWNGAAWSEVTTSPSPPARSLFAMAYDRTRGEVVLFGGVDETGARLGDTWAWTQSGGWVEHMPLSSPSPRVRHTMTFDPIRGEIVLFGGAIGGAQLDDAWSWDGTTWQRVFPEGTPPPFSDGAAAYDSARRHMLFHSATGTRRLQWRGVASDEACRSAIDRDRDKLVGCADPDCAGFCTPLCPAGGPCTGPFCGDMMCSPLESCRLCDRDCGFCAPRCGDTYCDGGETCSGECPS